MGRKANTFTVEEALSLFARAGNDDQRREILERLTLARLRELAKEQGIALEFNIKKEFVINLIMKELSQRHETELEAREPEEQRQEVRETTAERKARLEQEMREREAAAAKPEAQEDTQIEDLPLNQLRQLAGVSQQEVAKAIRCNLDDYLNVEYWGRGKGVSRLIAAKA
ncbi:MAG: hypothetical protein IJ520_07385, partial [Synergistaceae bacterium]|nr:hypothetical protein [Synergistaceae bacterium]